MFHKVVEYPIYHKTPRRVKVGRWPRPRNGKKQRDSYAQESLRIEGQDESSVADSPQSRARLRFLAKRPIVPKPRKAKAVCYFFHEPLKRRCLFEHFQFEIVIPPLLAG